MDLELRWLSPFDLVESRGNFIYEVDNFERIPDMPGIYVFGRDHGGAISPLYIGKAISLCTRIEQQLNNVGLMRAIQRAPNAYRVLYVAEFICKTGQNLDKAIAVIESALISAAMVEGFELINKQGTKTLAHTISSTGNREARSWLPENVIRLRSA